MIDRATYSSLDWLGDIGGLYDALRLICIVIVKPIVKFRLSLEVLVSLFHILPKGQRNNETELDEGGERKADESSFYEAFKKLE